mgnify:CR=1 FL=1
MKKALIYTKEPGRICEVHPTGFPVASTMQWIDCNDDVTSELHRYVNGVIEFIPAHVPTKTELNARVLAEIERLEKTTIRQLLDIYHNRGDTPDAGGKTPRKWGQPPFFVGRCWTSDVQHRPTFESRRAKSASQKALENIKVKP